MKTKTALLALGVAAAGYGCLQSTTDTTPKLPENFSGTATFNCSAHRYKAEESIIKEDTREDLRDSTLTLTLSNGKITNWESLPSESIPSRAIGTIEKVSQHHCTHHKDECTADYSDTNNNRIYLYQAKYIHADNDYIDLSVATISNDFKLISSFDNGYITQGKGSNYLAGYSCTLKSSLPQNTPS